MVEKPITLTMREIPMVLPEEKRDNAERTLVTWQKAALLAFAAGVIIGTWFGGMKYAIGLVGGVTMIYFVLLVFKSLITAHSLRASQITVAAEELAELSDEDLPTYSILVPLYKEAEVVRDLVWNLLRIDYPKEKLQVILLLEEDDQETIQAVRSLSLPSHFEIVVVEGGYPKTKPRACNVGLKRARGEYCVIYDAEDRPEEDQLNKAVIAFEKVERGVACIQARLHFWNPQTNLLTQWFAAEYGIYYHLVLPGLGKLGMPVPLGGTSNHFRTEVLREIDGWDSFNVTEDIDLGMWIARRGWKTQVLDSVTWEEANCHLGNWIRQRSRWVKGYLQTYLTHMRSPRRLLKDLGLMNFLVFQLIVGGTPLTMLFNPIFWGMTVAYAFTRSAFIEQLFPPLVFYIGMVNMVLGNFIFTYYVMTGCMIRERWTDLKWMLLSPVYWLLMSIGAWKALLQLLFKPHYWEKTRHGLVTLPQERRIRSLERKPARSFVIQGGGR